MFPEISIHAPRERSDKISTNCIVNFCISIHAPRERSDLTDLTRRLTASEFQSTLLVRGATNDNSIFFLTNKFQSTLLVRGATANTSGNSFDKIFQSTLLVRGATAESTKNIRNQYLFCTNTGFSLIFFNVFGREKHHFISFFIANLMFAWHSLKISYHHKASKFPLLHNVLFWTCNCFPDYIF